MNFLIKTTMLSTCSLLLVGCANFNSIHRLNTLRPNGQTELVDAKQRAIFAVKNTIPSFKDLTEEQTASLIAEFETHPVYRVCAEPAPDVFSIYALAATAEGNVASNPGAASGTPGQTNASGSFTLGVSENGSTIERTQTINLIRESMYRTCERYLSGAITSDTLQIQAARDQRAMVAILAIEQLTGVVKRKPTILTTQAQATLVTANAELIAQQTRETEDLNRKQTEVDEAQSTFNAAKSNFENLNNGNCETILNTPAPETMTPEVIEMQETETTETVTTPDGTVEKVEKSETNTVEPNQDVSDTQADAVMEASELELSKTQCQGAKSTMNNAESELASKISARDAAKEKLDVTIELIKQIATTMHSVSSTGTGNGDQGSDPHSESRISTVADAVSEITKAAFSDQSEIVFTCMGVIRNVEYFDDPRLESCLNIIESQSNANIDKRKLDENIQQIRRETAEKLKQRQALQ